MPETSDVSRSTCCRCAEPARPSHRYCAKCHAAYMREWRRTHPLTPEQRLKVNARCYAKVYRNRGKLSPQSCEVEGCTQPTQMHHDDYGKPLAVRWLCREHHLALHRDTPAQTAA